MEAKVRFWDWWWKERAGDSADSVKFRSRLDEVTKATREFVIRAVRFLEPRLVLLVSLAAFVAAIIAAWNIPVFHRIWGDEFWDAKNGEGVRDLVLAATTLLGALIGLAGYLLLAVRTNAVQRQTELQREAQITDRFTKAVEQLGHKQVAVRLGAIYALERIAKDSERDFETIMETLAAYIREMSPWAKNGDSEAKPGNDVIAALAVLVRSIPDDHSLRQGTRQSGTDLRRTNFSGIDFPNANFSGFLFDESNFEDSFLREANFRRASLNNIAASRADLLGADFSYAHLVDADISHSLLIGANFTGAHLAYFNISYSQALSANFSQAHFYGATLSGTDFHCATGLSDASFVEGLYQKNHPPVNFPSGIYLPPPQWD
jgi:hypothetical protein